MREWSALLMKDLKLSRKVFFIGLVMNVFVAMLTLYMGTVASHAWIMFVPLAIAAAFHVLYVPIVVGISLKTEGSHLSLWLSNPRSAAQLLMSKLANGLLMMVISLVMLYVLSALLVIPEFSFIEPYWTDTWKLALFVFPHIIWNSIALSVWVAAFWALHQWLKFKLGRWSWAVVVGAIMTAGWIAVAFQATGLYRFVAQWGSITYKFPAISSFSVQTYAGGYVLDCIIAIGLFMLTAWIVDNKVEV